MLIIMIASFADAVRSFCRAVLCFRILLRSSPGTSERGWNRVLAGFEGYVCNLNLSKTHERTLIMVMAIIGLFGKLATMIGLETWAYTGGMAEAGYGWSWSWLYAAIVGIWGITVTEGWRIKERKLSVQFGTFRVTKVDRLRAEYLRSLPGTYGGAAPSITAIDALNASHSVTGDPTFIGREVKILTSVPVIAGLGLVLGALLTAIFIFEAFLSKLYDGPGKSVLVSRDETDPCTRQFRSSCLLYCGHTSAGSHPNAHVCRRRAQCFGYIPLHLGAVDRLGKPSDQVQSYGQSHGQNLVSPVFSPKHNARVSL